MSSKCGSCTFPILRGDSKLGLYEFRTGRMVGSTSGQLQDATRNLERLAYSHLPAIVTSKFECSLKT